MKPLLCYKYNISFGLEDPDTSEFSYDPNTKRFSGDIFNVVKEKFFLRNSDDDMNDFYKYCSFKIFKSFGNRIKNETGVYYSGVLGSLIDNKIDASFKPGDYYMDDRLVDFTKYVYNEPYLSMQFVNSERSLKRKDFAEFFSIFMPSFIFLTEYIALFFLSSVIAVVLLSLSLKAVFSLRKFLGLILIFTFFKKIHLRKSDFFAMFMIFFVLYKFIIQQALQNNIKTNKVLIDVSSIVTSREKLVDTLKSVCFIEDTKTNDFFKLATNGTFAHFIYNKLSSSNDRCFLVNGFHFNKFNKAITNYLFLVFGSFTVCLSMFTNFHQSDVFVNMNPYFDILMTVYIRKSLPKEIKRYLDVCFANVSELGFMINIFKYYDFLLNKRFPSKYNRYHSIEEYTQQFTQISNLALNDFKIVFHLYSFLILLILFIYLFSHLFRALKYQLSLFQ